MAVVTSLHSSQQSKQNTRLNWVENLGQPILNTDKFTTIFYIYY